MKRINLCSQEKTSKTKMNPKTSLRILTATIKSKKAKQSKILSMISYQAARRIMSKALSVNSQIKRNWESKIKKKNSKRSRTFNCK